jgi:hypothetical protein
MGRAARVKQQRRAAACGAVQLTELEFWQLRARAEEAARAMQEASATPQAIEAGKAGQRAAEALDALAKKYGFDAALALTFNEATFSLVPVPPQTPPK